MGCRKVGDTRSFFFSWLWTPFSTAFVAFKAFALASALGRIGVSFFAFSAPRRNKLDHYAINKFPLTIKSAMKKIEDNSTLVFMVDVKASKHQVKQAMKNLYEIEVSKKYPHKA